MKRDLDIKVTKEEYRLIKTIRTYKDTTINVIVADSKDLKNCRVKKYFNFYE